jgi:hypothetical protein
MLIAIFNHPLLLKTRSVVFHAVVFVAAQAL